MLPWRILSTGLILILLTACGNKGELFLLPSEATVDELESIDKAIDAIDQETDDESDEESESEKKNKNEN